MLSNEINFNSALYFIVLNTEIRGFQTSVEQKSSAKLTTPLQCDVYS